MNKKLLFYSLLAAISLYVIAYVTIDFIRFNITRQSINEAMAAKEVTQYDENNAVMAYVVEHDNGSTVYIYIKSAVANRYRRYRRFENEGNAILNGESIIVIGATNFFTFNRGSIYGVTRRSATWWFEPYTGEYILQISMFTQRGFYFWLFLRGITFLLLTTKVAYELFDRTAQKRQTVAIT